MSTQDFSTTFVVDQTAEQVFHAINNVRGWWSEEIEGSTDKTGEIFDYHYEDVHRCRIKVTELVPYTKVAWLVLDNYFKFTKDTSEWKDTRVIFGIVEKDGKTEIHFTHQGLVPEYECYDICRNAWSTYLHKSLHDLISTGNGAPNGKGKPRTENEKRLASEQ